MIDFPPDTKPRRVQGYHVAARPAFALPVGPLLVIAGIVALAWWWCG